ncbi:MAG: acetate/propionate family kinase [Verrucomicrobiales bacterium]|nr:acetate/propionate family kinase [Verrucomicrobiales bacterium]
MKSILCLNTGSSTIKFDLYRDEQVVDSGQRDSTGELNIDDILTPLAEQPDAIAHRVVHGGRKYSDATRIDDELCAELQRLIPLAPSHLPRAIAAIEKTLEHFPGIPQFACFDTAFHQRMPEIAKRYPFSKALWEKGVQRFGFHGLSYESIIESLEDRLPHRLVIAHLGNGCSLCAVRDGMPIDTTMGFTPTGGVMMGTRCGDLDPGVFLYLMRECNYSADDLDRLVNHEAGLLGTSGMTSDMRDLLSAASTHPDAAFAVDLYCYGIRKAIGSLAATLGGLDLLVFTGGIGENSPEIRNRILCGLDFLRCEVEVIPTNESLSMVRQVRKLSL